MDANADQDLNEPDYGEGEKDKENRVLHAALRHAIVVNWIDKLNAKA